MSGNDDSGAAPPPGAGDETQASDDGAAAAAPRDPAAERARAIALLEAAHQFPVRYEVTAIGFARDDVVAAVRAAVIELVGQPLADEDHTMVPSRGGKYTSHRLRVLCSTPDAVLDLYASLRAIDGVVTLL